MARASRVFALDLPSGLDADTGQPLGVAVRACATATFVAAKLGFAAPGAADYTGEFVVIDIGLPRCLLEPYLRKGPAVEGRRFSRKWLRSRLMSKGRVNMERTHSRGAKNSLMTVYPYRRGTST